jgi:hypothetical protein
MSSSSDSESESEDDVLWVDEDDDTPAEKPKKVKKKKKVQKVFTPVDKVSVSLYNLSIPHHIYAGSSRRRSYTALGSSTQKSAPNYSSQS